MTDTWSARPFGKTGFNVGPLGVGASFGVSAGAIEEAFDRGVNYFYWAWFRRMGMRDGVRKLTKTNREKIFITVTSLVPTGPMVRYCVDRARKALDTDYIDGLQFYLLKNRPVMKRYQLGSALKLKDEGVIKHIGVSSHHRPNFPKFAREDFCDFAHVRYNAKHRGAETDVFPHLPPKADPGRPGMVAFTATSWAQLIKAKPEKLDGLPVPTAGDCYRFALSHPDIDVCLTGPSNDAQMRHALDAVDKGPMTEDEIDWMRKVGDKLNKK